MMSSVRLGRLAAPALLGLLAAGCAALPSAGPTAGAMKQNASVDVVDVTPAVAESENAAAAAREKDAVDRAVALLQAPPPDVPFRFGPGDIVDITLWSFSPWPGANPLSSNNPGPIPLGAYTLSPEGEISLPYAGRIRLTGLGLGEAQDAISRDYAARRILQQPTAVIKLAAAPNADVIVTGSVGQPRAIPWTPAGLTLAQAVTQSLGDGGGLLAQGDLAQSRSAVRVAVLRGHDAPVALPMAVALEQTIPLRAGDRIVVSKAPAVQVSVLGGGARKNGIYGYPRQPLLSEVLADAAGLDGAAANTRGVFVLRRGNGGRPVLYNFAWNRTQGVIASQQFPLQDADLVYVAEAPVVAVQKVINLLFQATLPAQVLR
jgi:polysaccharide export outer membrane protein